MRNRDINIVYGQSLRQVQGINYVNNSFVEGAKYFKALGFNLKKIYSPLEVFECTNNSNLNLIGRVGKKEFVRKRRIRLFFKRMLPAKFFLTSYFRFILTFVLPSYKAAKKYVKSKENAEYIIFQDIFSAYFYYKLSNRNNKMRCILILHCSYSPYEQLELLYPVLFRNTLSLHWFNKVEKCVEKNINKVVYLSKRAVDSSLWDKSKLTYIHNGIEDVKYNIISECHQPLNICCVGSMDGRKGQELLIEAMEKIQVVSPNRCLLHLIGGGPLKDDLERYAVSLGVADRIIFYGIRNDVQQILQRMDIFILPSKSEGMPMSMIEALRQGMFVMGTDTGAIPEMMTPEFGCLIKRDADDISSKILSIIEKDYINKDIKRKAREYYLQHFTLSVMISEYAKVLNAIR